MYAQQLPLNQIQNFTMPSLTVNAELVRASSDGGYAFVENYVAYSVLYKCVIA